jgi:hypothetical protein
VSIRLVLKGLARLQPAPVGTHAAHQPGHYIMGCRECVADLMVSLVGRAATGDRAELAVPAPGESGQDSRSAGH